MRNPKASVTTNAPTWIVWLSIPDHAWSAGKASGRAKPAPTATLLRTNDRENAAARREAVVWSAMIAFHVERKAPSPTPEMTAASTSHRTSVVKAKTSRDGGRMMDAI